MSTRSHHTTTGLFASLLLLWAMLVSTAAVAAAPPGGHLNVTEVLVDDPNNPTQLVIIGSDFLLGPAPLVVTLGDFGALTILGTPSDSLIEAQLPANIVPGDYLLTVARGAGQSQNDEYDLTIGAVGPQGPQGETGPQGAQGPQGPQGVPGPTGPQGAQGFQGPQGAQGPAGPAGPIGISGYQIVADNNNFNAVVIPPHSGWSMTIFCPGSKKILGGGCSIVGTSTPVPLSSSVNFNNNGWACGWRNETGAPITTALLVTAICANVN